MRHIGILAVAVSLGIGCKRTEPPPVVSATTSHALPVNTSVVTEAALGLPFYPGSVEKGTSSRMMETTKERTTYCDRTTGDDPKKVADFYLAKVTKGRKSSLANGMLVSGLLKDHSVVQIQVMPAGPKVTEIGITVHLALKK